MLLDEDNYQRYVANQRYNFFQGTTGTIRSIGRYTFVIPQTGIYHIVLDNRRAWFLPRNVTLHLYSVLPEATPESERIQQAFEKEYALLKKAFIFDDFNISFATAESRMPSLILASRFASNWLMNTSGET